MPKLFGTSGIRGPADTLFTKDFCRNLGTVYGAWLTSKGKEGYVAVAMDPRESSPVIKRHIISGLASQGWEILDEGVIPTPALTYFVKQSPSVGGGVMITGSHITANLNGVKLFINGEEVSKVEELEIEKLFENWKLKIENSTTPIIKFENSAKDLYLNMLKKLATTYPKWLVVVDSANGTQSEIIFNLLDDLKIKYFKTGDCDIQSPVFIPRDTEVSSSFAEISRQVLLHKADLGIAFDVDGDRIIFIDDQGRYLPGDYSCTLIAQQEDSKAIVTPINTSSVIDSIGKTIYRTPVGSTHVAAKMKEVGAKFGFEPNGGGIFADVAYGRDGGVTLIKMLNLLKASKKKLSDLYSALPQFHLYREKTDCPFDKYDRIYAAVREKYSDLNDLDGLKVDLGHDEWILF